MAETLRQLSKTERTILEKLRAGEQFGLQLVEDGVLKRGTVYVTLARMEQKRYVKSRQETPPPRSIGLPRRWYSATPYGRRVLEAWREAQRAFDTDTASRWWTQSGVQDGEAEGGTLTKVERPKAGTR